MACAHTPATTIIVETAAAAAATQALVAATHGDGWPCRGHTVGHMCEHGLAVVRHGSLGGGMVFLMVPSVPMLVVMCSVAYAIVNRVVFTLACVPVFVLALLIVRSAIFVVVSVLFVVRLTIMLWLCCV